MIFEVGFDVSVGATILLVVLKLAGVIAWSWVWVLSPLWVLFAFFGVLVFIAGVFGWFDF